MGYWKKSKNTCKIQNVEIILRGNIWRLITRERAIEEYQKVLSISEVFIERLNFLRSYRINRLKSVRDSSFFRLYKIR